MDLGFEGGFSVHRSWLSAEELAKYRGFDSLGFTTLQDLSFQTIFACDVNAKAKAAWDGYFSRRRSIDRVFHLGSIVDVVKQLKSGEMLFRHGIDVVTGGFPCNDFSVAGKRLGFQSDKSHQGNKKLIQGDDDPSIENRGMLYFWMREFISITQPKVFFAENVKGLVSLGDAKEIITQDFGSINGGGYHVLPVRVLKAIDFGVPQTRERVIFIGVNKAKLRPTVRKYLEENGELPESLSLYPLKSHGIGDLVSTFRPVATCVDAFTGLGEPDQSADLAHQAYSKARYFNKGQGSSEIILCRPGPTIRAEHHGNIEFRRLSLENGGRNSGELSARLPQRRLSVRECARLQTFPDDYEFVVPGVVSASDGYRLIGNAVPPLLGYRLAQRLEQVWPELFVNK